MPAQRVYKQRHQSVKVCLSIESDLVFMNLIRILSFFFHRSAFAPLYGNQYSGQQSNQYWPNSGSHYGSSGNAGMSSLLKHDSDDLDGPLHNINRKEKRQYKKRKHKNQREKQPSGMCYL